VSEVATRVPLVSALIALVEATTAPPEGEPDDLLAAFDAMVAGRAAILAQLQPLVEGALPFEAEALKAELARRDEAWLTALARAQGVVGDRLRAVRRAQQAQR
jgi:hypothetical protein